jgi:hypothetical protein
MGEFTLTVRPGQPQRNADAGAVARALGGNGAPSSDGWCRCPCPAHRGTGSNLSIKTGGPGRLVVKCWSRGCPPAAVLLAIDQQLGTSFSRADASADFAEAEADFPVAEAGPDAQLLALCRAEEAGLDAALRTEAAERLFQSAKPIEHGDLVDRYLRDHRGIALEQFPAALRLHPGLHHRESQNTWPGLVARVVVGAGRFLTAHRTFLSPETAGKAPVDPVRKLFSSMRGGAVRLFDPGGNQLLVGEGIETVLAALVLSSWSYAGWAAISTSGVVALQVPRRYHRVVIAADNDANGAGLRAARALAKRLRAAERRADILMPPQAGCDWNDFLITQTRQGKAA